MTAINYQQMSREELRTFMLEHRNDETAFHVYMDKLSQESLFIEGKDEDLATPEAFANLMERLKDVKAKQKARDAASKDDLGGATISGISQTIHQQGLGDNIGGDKVEGDKYSQE